MQLKKFLFIIATLAIIGIPSLSHAVSAGGGGGGGATVAPQPCAPEVWEAQSEAAQAALAQRFDLIGATIDPPPPTDIALCGHESRRLTATLAEAFVRNQQFPNGQDAERVLLAGLTDIDQDQHGYTLTNWTGMGYFSRSSLGEPQPVSSPITPGRYTCDQMAVMRALSRCQTHGDPQYFTPEQASFHPPVTLQDGSGGGGDIPGYLDAVYDTRRPTGGPSCEAMMASIGDSDWTARDRSIPMEAYQVALEGPAAQDYEMLTGGVYQAAHNITDPDNCGSTAPIVLFVTDDGQRIETCSQIGCSPIGGVCRR